MAKKLSKLRIPSARSEDQPATRKMLSLVRDEILQKMESGFKQVDSRFKQMGSGFKQLESGLDELRSANARMQLLMEEQNSNNRIVLEGLQTLWQRQDRIERQLR